MSALRRAMMVVLALVLSGGLNGVMGQRGLRGGGLGLHGLGPRLGGNVELALEHQEGLSLTAQQIASLQEMRTGIQQNMAPLEVEITNLRTLIMEDEVDREEGLTRLRQLLEQYRTAAEPYRSGVTTILTVDQHRRLQAQVQSDRGAEGRLLGRAGGGRGVGRGSARRGRLQQRLLARGMRQRMRVHHHRNRIIRGGGGSDGPYLW